MTEPPTNYDILDALSKPQRHKVHRVSQSNDFTIHLDILEMARVETK